MPSDSSFDIVSQVDLQEIDNAINQTMKEVGTRYDFRGTRNEINWNRDEKKLTFLAADDMKLKSLKEILQTKLSKRGVSVKSLKFAEQEKALDGMIRQGAEIIQGIPQEKAKEIVKKIKDLKLKVQASIQSDQIRVSAKSKDDLQTVMQFTKNSVTDLPLQFTNYR